MRTSLRRIAMATAAAGLALTSACTAGSSSTNTNAGPKADAPQTITVWHGWTADHEVQAITDATAAFHTAHPNITVKLVKGIQDDKITQAIRGGNPPDVVSSFTTDSLGAWCHSGAWQDLGPWLKKDKVDTKQFPTAILNYTQYKGTQCAMPLLADTYGLYYNKTLLGKNPVPKTASELTALAKKLTTFNPDGSIKVAGFIPSAAYYEMIPDRIGPTFGITWFGPDGKSSVATDPAFKAYAKWDKDLVDFYGYAKLQKFIHGLGQEFEKNNPFEAGKVAMSIDGEWRTKFIAEEAPKLDYGTAPVVTADDKTNVYGGGFLSGTLIGIPKGSPHAQAAWEYIKYLTTNTDSLVGFANALGNVPSTFASAASPNLKLPAQFQTFADIFKNPNSKSSPPTINGNTYITDAQKFMAEQWEAGKVPDLDKGLQDLAAKTDKAIQLAGG
ncbi:MAG: ABC-type sugar transport system periplasmic component-like protein [Actinomycetia bacterium]|nr:ABC-type sugar transport system periplasmic component-like protein [Actinomycetes bacterium]